MEVAGPLGTPLGLAQRKRASPRGEAALPAQGRLLRAQGSGCGILTPQALNQFLLMYLLICSWHPLAQTPFEVVLIF